MKRALLIALLAFAPAMPAAAQDVFSWAMIMPSVTHTDPLSMHLDDMMVRQEARRRGVAPPATRGAAQPSRTPAASPATLRFTPTVAARKANFDRLLADRRRQGDAATTAEFAGLLSNPDLMPSIDREMRARGLSATNMADAFAIWWVQAWQTSRGDTSDPSPAALKAVKGQAEAAMLSMPALTGLPDAQKQGFAEGLLVQAAILGSAAEQVKADPAQSRKLAGIARANARQAGLDLDAVRLTDQGFVGPGAATGG